MAAGGTAQRIVVIEDDAALAGVLRDLLEEEGYQVETRLFAESAADVVTPVPPDLVIVDGFGGGDASGWRLVEQLRCEPAGPPVNVLICSGASREIEGRADWLQRLGVRVVTKPFDLDTLVSAVRQALPH